MTNVLEALSMQGGNDPYTKAWRDDVGQCPSFSGDIEAYPAWKEAFKKWISQAHPHQLGRENHFLLTSLPNEQATTLKTEHHRLHGTNPTAEYLWVWLEKTYGSMDPNAHLEKFEDILPKGGRGQI